MLSDIGDDGNRLSIIAGQHTHHGWLPLRLKGDTVSGLESQHLAVCTHLVQKAKTLHDSMIEVDKFRFGEFVNVGPHVSVCSFGSSFIKILSESG